MLYPVSVEGKFGFIDAHGKMVIAPQFLKWCTFCEGLAAVEVPGSGEHAELFGLNDEGFIDEQGEFVIGPGLPPGYQIPDDRSRMYSYGDFHDGLARFWLGDSTGCGGYIDRSGRIVIPPQFPSAGDFSDGLACVCLPRDDGSPFGPKKTGFIDRTGKFVFPAKDDFDVFRFSEGLCVVSHDNHRSWWQWGNVGRSASVIDLRGKVVVPAGRFEHISHFSGRLAIVRKNDMVGCIDRVGKIVIPLEFDQLWEFDDSEFTTGEKDGRKLIVNRSGECVREIDSELDISRLRSGFVRAKLGAKIGYLNTNGELAIPLQFDRGEDFRGELALVKQGERQGYINQRGEFVWETSVWDEPLRYSVSPPLSDLLPPQTIDALPLDYNWGSNRNAIVFASDMPWEKLLDWYELQLTSDYRVTRDPSSAPNCVNFNLAREGFVGSLHATHGNSEAAQGFVEHYCSENLYALRNKYPTAIWGMLIQDC